MQIGEYKDSLYDSEPSALKQCTRIYPDEKREDTLGIARGVNQTFLDLHGMLVKQGDRWIKLSYYRAWVASIPVEVPDWGNWQPQLGDRVFFRYPTHPARWGEGELVKLAASQTDCWKIQAENAIVTIWNPWGIAPKDAEIAFK